MAPGSGQSRVNQTPQWRRGEMDYVRSGVVDEAGARLAGMKADCRGGCGRVVSKHLLNHDGLCPDCRLEEHRSDR